MELFVDWVYTDTVPFRTTPASFRQLFDLFLLAQKLCQHPRLRDLAMNRIRQHCRQGVEAVELLETIRSCYGEIEADSPLRRWLLRYVAWIIVNEGLDLEKYASLVEDGSAADLIQALIDVPAPFRDPRGGDPTACTKRTRSLSSVLLGAFQGMVDVLIEGNGKGCAKFFFVGYVNRWEPSLVICGPKVASACKGRPIGRTFRPEEICQARQMRFYWQLRRRWKT